MTQLAHDAVLLEIPVDISRLYDEDDPNYSLWIHALCEEVLESRKRQKREAEKKSK